MLGFLPLWSYCGLYKCMTNVLDCCAESWRRSSGAWPVPVVERKRRKTGTRNETGKRWSPVAIKWSMDSSSQVSSLHTHLCRSFRPGQVFGCFVWPPRTCSGPPDCPVSSCARSVQPRPVTSSLDVFSPLLHERGIETTPVSAGTLWRSLQTYLVRRRAREKASTQRLLAIWTGSASATMSSLNSCAMEMRPSYS